MAKKKRSGSKKLKKLKAAGKRTVSGMEGNTHTGGTSGTPGTTDTPGKPGTPDTTHTTDTTDSQDMPDAPATPATQDMPDNPDTQNKPDIREEGDMADIPKMCQEYTERSNARAAERRAALDTLKKAFVDYNQTLDRCRAAVHEEVEALETIEERLDRIERKLNLLTVATNGAIQTHQEKKRSTTERERSSSVDSHMERLKRLKTRDSEDSKQSQDQDPKTAAEKTPEQKTPEEKTPEEKTPQKKERAFSHDSDLTVLKPRTLTYLVEANYILCKDRVLSDNTSDEDWYHEKSMFGSTTGIRIEIGTQKKNRRTQSV